mmetsp:Transcript_21456/g.48746  ORF Transcript_21456/g.48746 Transcript_21456/m.48746 type:complete len:138 (-) Transcript_21456:217-630(-)
MLYKNNHVFDSSLERGDPYTLQVGIGHAIKGWDLGLNNMCIGERRKVVVPADLAYGDDDVGDDIHPGATLVYEMELLDIEEVGYDPFADDETYRSYFGEFEPYESPYAHMGLNENDSYESNVEESFDIDSRVGNDEL